MRVSRALNYLGQPIRRTAAMLTSSGSDGKWYAPRVAEFDGYMRRTYSAPAVDADGPARGPTERSAFSGKRGIIEFKVTGWTDATGHFDL
ncbi:T6SS effector amidase Tae4 family protein [Sphingomonas sp. PB4P5]|uniref:T6SS effector amidase Tae4 family protein n=1 Tax=Parasphingomonas puruogangriensis TaxID=3096155 RepID=UPI002FCAE435